MRKITALVVLLAATLVVPAKDSGDRPSGVSKKEWVAISENLGLVVVSQSSTQAMVQVDPAALLVALPVNGYFMVKRNGQWRRLVVLEPTSG